MFRRTIKKRMYDKENLKPIIKSSIRTGEQVVLKPKDEEGESYE